MTSSLMFAVAGVALFGIGCMGLLRSGTDLRRILALNVMGVGVFNVLIATAYDPAGASDPVPHALVITGIVVAVSATAFALVLARAAGRDEDAD